MASETASTSTRTTAKIEHITAETTAKQRLDEADEALIVGNLVSFFQPLVQGIDRHVEALRYSTDYCDL